MTRSRKFIFIPFAIAAFVFLFSAFVMLLWNNVLAEVLHISKVSFWQAMGILVLSKILFGLPFGGPGRRGMHGPPWARGMREKLKNMSPEEQKKFRDEMKSRFGHMHGHSCGNPWGGNPFEKNTDTKSEAATNTGETS